jgi:hypothetical protein
MSFLSAAIAAIPDSLLADIGGAPGGTLPGIITDSLKPACDFQTGVLKASCIPLFIAHVIKFVFSLVSAIFLINVMLGGYQLAIGAIRGTGKDEGQARILYSIIGLILCVSVVLIIDLVLTLFLGS